MRGKWRRWLTRIYIGNGVPWATAPADRVSTSEFRIELGQKNMAEQSGESRK